MQPSIFPVANDKNITKISRAAHLRDLGSHIRIVVNHHHLFEYKKGDKASEVAAIVTLYRAGVAKQTEIARAFGLSRHTVRRYLHNVERYGSAGLFMTKTGPQGAHKITPKVHKFIADQIHQNKGVACILRAVKDQFDLKLSRKSIERIRDSLPQQSSTQVETSSFAPEQLSLIEEDETSAEGSPDLLPAEPLLAKDAISSGDALEAGTPKQTTAGLFLLWPFLHLLGFGDIVDSIFGPIRGRFFFVRETLLTILLLAFLRCRSIEDYKLLEKRHLGLFWEGSRGMDLRTLRRKLSVLSFQNKALPLLTRLAQRYREIGLVQLGVLYFDGHFVPYYGDKNVHKGFFTLRRLVVPGQEQFFLNDARGRPFFFWLKTADRTLLEMLPEIIEQIKQLTAQESFTIVFDRGGFSSKLFRTLDGSGVKFITYLRGAGQQVDASAFNNYTIQYRHREEQAQLAELGYIGTSPEYYRLVVRKKDQKQTSILTNDWQRTAQQVATLMFNRWSQENFFKYMIREYHLDSLLSYLAEETAELIMVKNPARKENRRTKKQLNQELQQLEHFLAEKLGVSRKRALSKTMAQKIRRAHERAAEIKETIKRLNAEHRKMPERVSASQLGDDRPRQVLCQEKKVLVDSLKLLAYNAEEWLLDIVTKEYKNYRDFRRVLLLILKQPGTIQRIDDRTVIRLHSLHNPKYQRAAVYLCEEINQMKIPAPSGKGTMYFGVEKAA